MSEIRKKNSQLSQKQQTYTNDIGEANIPQEQSKTTARKSKLVKGIKVPKNYATSEMTLNQKAIALILHWHEYIIHLLKNIDRSNIDDIAEITLLIHRIHRKLICSSPLKEINDDFVFEVKGQDLKFAVIKYALKNLATLYGFNYSHKALKEKRKIIVLGTILMHIALFRENLKEVQNGNDKIKYFKTVDGVVQCVDETPIHEFGLNRAHYTLLSGCTYHPSTQSIINSNLGPMTIAINLCTASSKSKDSWTKVFCRTFRVIPRINEIAEILTKSQNSRHFILRELATIANAGATKSSSKAFIPASLLLIAAHQAESFSKKFKKSYSTTPIEEADLPDTILNLDFSGKGLYYFWNETSKFKFKIRKGKGMTERTASEIVLHAAFRTHRENLILLQWLTGHDFQTHRQIDEQFTEVGSLNESTVSFNLINFKRVYDLTNTTQPYIFVEGYGQVFKYPDFSGKFTEKIYLDEDFRSLQNDFLNECRSYPSFLTFQGEVSLIHALRSLGEKITNKMKNKVRIQFGAPSFFQYESDLKGTSFGTRIDAPATISETYFYQES